METRVFIDQQIRNIAARVGSGSVIAAVSGGVDSSTAFVLGRRALGNQCRGFLIDNGLMREGEAQKVEMEFDAIGFQIRIIDSQDEFFDALEGLVDPEEKRKAITRVFYAVVFRELARCSDARFLLQGTIRTDVEETVAGIKRQHNVLSQLGVDTRKEFGYTLIEPLAGLRKPQVREVAKALGLPESMWNRMPFPGPALATRVIGKVTRCRVEIVRRATAIVEEELAGLGAFQNMAILHTELVTGVRNGKRSFGYQIQVRCWDSVDATVATPTRVPYGILERIADRIVVEIPQVVSVVYAITAKPPSTMEAV